MSLVLKSMLHVQYRVWYFSIVQVWYYTVSYSLPARAEYRCFCNLFLKKEGSCRALNPPVSRLSEEQGSSRGHHPVREALAFTILWVPS